MFVDNFCHVQLGGKKLREGAAGDTGNEPRRLRDKGRGSKVFLHAPAMLAS
jgi:hypothetical protein